MADPWIVPTLLDVARLFPAKLLALVLDCPIPPAAPYDPYPYAVDPALELAPAPPYDL